MKGTKVQVVYSFDTSGRLSVEAMIPGVGSEAKMELQRQRAMPNSRLQQWKKVICQDGGYSKIESVAALIDSALEEEAVKPMTLPAPVKHTSLEPAIAKGAPLAASEVLKHNLQGTRNGASSPLRNRTAGDRMWINITGHVVFSLLGTLGGLYLVCRYYPQFREYLPVWLIEHLFK